MCITEKRWTQPGRRGAAHPWEKCLHQPQVMRNNPVMNRRNFSEESKKKLWRPCREARALGL